MPYGKDGSWKMGPVYLPDPDAKSLPPKPAVDHPSYDVWAAVARKMAANAPSETELDKFKKGLYGNGNN